MRAARERGFELGVVARRCATYTLAAQLQRAAGAQRQTDSGIAAAAVGALLLAVPLLRSVAPAAVAAWVVCLFAGYLVRQRLMQRASAQGSLERVRRVALVGSAVLGVIVTAPAPLFYAACSAETTGHNSERIMRPTFVRSR